MEPATANFEQLVASSRRFAQRFFTSGGNRIALLLVELQEERERLRHSILLAFGVAALGFFAVLGFNLAIAIWLWSLSPVAVLLGVIALYTGGAMWLYRRLTKLLGEWTRLSATLDQLRKDRACLEHRLS